MKTNTEVSTTDAKTTNVKRAVVLIRVLHQRRNQLHARQLWIWPVQWFYRSNIEFTLIKYDLPWSSPLFQPMVTQSENEPKESAPDAIIEPIVGENDLDEMSFMSDQNRFNVRYSILYWQVYVWNFVWRNIKSHLWNSLSFQGFAPSNSFGSFNAQPSVVSISEYVQWHHFL